MNCQDMVEFLMDYLDDELSGGEKRRFEGHLKVCPECVDYLDSYGETVRFGNLCNQNNEPAPEMPEELVAAILAARQK
jgi:predicted anti-sigma-YlaC factor YlaD